MANNPTNFWLELKRRRVIRVIIGYLASAYVLLELASIVIEPLGLPEWTIKFILVLLVVGFIIAVSLSWIYDFTSKGIVKTESNKVTREKAQEQQPTKKKLRMSDVIIAVLVIAVVVLAYPKVFKKEKSLFDQAFENKKSIAILPFVNNTGDSAYDHWELGISDLLINALSTSNELSVIDNQTIYEVIDNANNVRLTSIGPEMAREVANRIKVESYIYGNYILAGSTFRINLKLINTRSNKVLNTEYEEGVADSIISMVGSLSTRIKDYLEIQILREDSQADQTGFVNTKSPAAYRHFIQGLEKYWSGHGGAHVDFREAIKIDSSFYEAYFFMSLARLNTSYYDQAKNELIKANEGKDKLSPRMQIWLKALMTQYFDKNPQLTNLYYQQLTEIDPLFRQAWLMLGWGYYQVADYENALNSFEQIIKLNKQFGPFKAVMFYRLLGGTFEQLGQYKEALKWYKEGIQLFPQANEIIFQQAVCALQQKDSIAAINFINQHRLVCLSNGFTESLVRSRTGFIYMFAGQYQKAIEYCQMGLDMSFTENDRPSWDPQQWYYHALGYVLIKGDINIEEGMENLQKAAELSQKDMSFIHSGILIALGEGYYKQGKYKEALEALRAAEEQQPFYNHSLHQHIQESQQALANHHQ